MRAMLLYIALVTVLTFDLTVREKSVIIIVMQLVTIIIRLHMLNSCIKGYMTRPYIPIPVLYYYYIAITAS